LRASSIIPAGMFRTAVAFSMVSIPMALHRTWAAAGESRRS
jgi:hypothetical protein